MSKILQWLLFTVAFAIGLSGFAINATSLNSGRHDITVEILGGKHFMTSKLQGIMAAPNQSEIKAKVLHIEQSKEFQDKWYLELEILESKNITGGNFAQTGDKVKAFTIQSSPNFSTNNIITAQAEFLGDAHGGFFRLNNIQVVKE
ncbi:MULTISPECIES: hypothetical protein [Nostoc]|uniref:Uncharacterized protein n=1 Tax=Nostoc paludosum FACHB-159 TaxID=2692908 RepID=A0ABR8KI68_9NOSO|nr:MULTISPECIES: hypothetical protein [Nostoc]MBD2682910.1 hypothetical protein [Nostoc sp. FACHB-857]MBD2739247.1 hypothetical protein [Nostoc paludosum FACHB-159]